MYVYTAAVVIVVTVRGIDWCPFQFCLLKQIFEHFITSLVLQAGY